MTPAPALPKYSYETQIQMINQIEILIFHFYSFIGRIENEK